MNIFDEMTFDNNKNISQLYEPYEGYMKGNLFKNLYKEYKNYKPARLIPNNEQAELLLNINQIGFAEQDIRLYLDMYPNDRKMIDLFNKLVSKCKELTSEYEKRYGPIKSNTIVSSDTFNWVSYDFPWEEGAK